MLRRESWWVRGLVGLAITVGLLLVGSYLLNPFGAQGWDPRERVLGHALYRVPSAAMAPALTPGQVVIARVAPYRRRTPARGDLVVFVSPVDGNRWLKRVVGLPGEQVAIVDGSLQVDGREVVEDYVAPGNRTQSYSVWMEGRRVPPGHVLLLGDNRDNSHDGRLFGFVAVDRLVARVVGLD
ncbi:signal peptidase I [Luteimonas terrae]|uniref:Signal peptidase I n=1 Tax=Luteimonas terrae TaxID=1530191 RepID=A0ABU1XWY8_9GAMM|nr:signal peptidase I [Luteimonas terrae]MDR7193123.1 signal peptidase I [Luteimonas terrae]